MKKALIALSCLTVLFVTVITAFAQIPIQQGAKKRIFFLGNSLVGDKKGGLPAYVQAACNAANPSIDFEPFRHIEGAKYLEYFWGNNNVKEKIRTGNYDIVVLQDYYDDQDDPATFCRYADSFSVLIRSVGALPVFYMRWPNGPQWEGMETFDRNVAKLQKNYDDCAAKLNIPVVPANLVWQQLTHNPYGDYPNSWLYTTNSDGRIDAIHPSEIGKYATTLTFYSILTQQSPIGVYFDYGFAPYPSHEVQAHVQKAVWDVISSRESWAVTANYLRVDPLSLSFESAAANNTIAVTTDQSGLTAQPNQSWISATIVAGSVKVSVSENTTTADRSGEVVISAGSLSKTIAIVQKRPRLCDFTVSSKVFNADWRDTSMTVTVTSDQPWQATKSTDWVTLTQSGNTITIAVAQNSVRNFRYDSVIVAGCESEVIRIAQNFPNSADEEWDSLIIQAEDFSAATGYVPTNYPLGFTGTTPNGALSSEAIGNTVSWTVPVTEAGQYSLAFSYANGNANTRTVNLVVNNNQVESLSFPKTGPWAPAVWTAVQTTAPITLNAGANTIQLVVTSAKGPVLDKLVIKSVGLPSSTTPLQSTLSAPESFSLSINSGREAHISYALPQSSTITLNLYSLQGKMVKQLYAGSKNKGTHEMVLNNSALRPGLYLLELNSGASRLTQQFSVIR